MFLFEKLSLFRFQPLSGEYTQIVESNCILYQSLKKEGKWERPGNLNINCHMQQNHHCNDLILSADQLLICWKRITSFHNSPYTSKDPPNGCFQKWWYPQIIHFNRVFHYFHHPFWGCFPVFWKILQIPPEVWCLIGSLWGPANIY